MWLLELRVLESRRQPWRFSQEVSSGKWWSRRNTVFQEDKKQTFNKTKNKKSKKQALFSSLSQASYVTWCYSPPSPDFRFFIHKWGALLNDLKDSPKMPHCGCPLHKSLTLSPSIPCVDLFTVPRNRTRQTEHSPWLVESCGCKKPFLGHGQEIAWQSTLATCPDWELHLLAYRELSFPKGRSTAECLCILWQFSLVEANINSTVQVRRQL